MIQSPRNSWEQSSSFAKSNCKEPRFQLYQTMLRPQRRLVTPFFPSSPSQPPVSLPSCPPVSPPSTAPFPACFKPPALPVPPLVCLSLSSRPSPSGSLPHFYPSLSFILFWSPFCFLPWSQPVAVVFVNKHNASLIPSTLWTPLGQALSQRCVHLYYGRLSWFEMEPGVEESQLWISTKVCQGSSHQLPQEQLVSQLFWAWLSITPVSHIRR